MRKHCSQTPKYAKYAQIRMRHWERLSGIGTQKQCEIGTQKQWEMGSLTVTCSHRGTEREEGYQRWRSCRQWVRSRPQSLGTQIEMETAVAATKEEGGGEGEGEGEGEQVFLGGLSRR